MALPPSSPTLRSVRSMGNTLEEGKLACRRGGRGGGGANLNRPRESLVFFYRSFNTLWGWLHSAFVLSLFWSKNYLLFPPGQELCDTKGAGVGTRAGGGVY